MPGYEDSGYSKIMQILKDSSNPDSDLTPVGEAYKNFITKEFLKKELKNFKFPEFSKDFNVYKISFLEFCAKFMTAYGDSLLLDKLKINDFKEVANSFKIISLNDLKNSKFYDVLKSFSKEMIKLDSFMLLKINSLFLANYEEDLIKNPLNLDICSEKDKAFLKIILGQSEENFYKKDLNSDSITYLLSVLARMIKSEDYINKFESIIKDSLNSQLEEQNINYLIKDLFSKNGYSDYSIKLLSDIDLLNKAEDVDDNLSKIIVNKLLLVLREVFDRSKTETRVKLALEHSIKILCKKFLPYCLVIDLVMPQGVFAIDGWDYFSKNQKIIKSRFNYLKGIINDNSLFADKFDSENFDEMEFNDFLYKYKILIEKKVFIKTVEFPQSNDFFNSFNFFNLNIEEKLQKASFFFNSELPLSFLKTSSILFLYNNILKNNDIEELQIEIPINIESYLDYLNKIYSEFAEKLKKNIIIFNKIYYFVGKLMIHNFLKKLDSVISENINVKDIKNNESLKKIIDDFCENALKESNYKLFFIEFEWIMNNENYLTKFKNILDKIDLGIDFDNLYYEIENEDSKLFNLTFNFSKNNLNIKVKIYYNNKELEFEAKNVLQKKFFFMIFYNDLYVILDKSYEYFLKINEENLLVFENFSNIISFLRNDFGKDNDFLNFLKNPYESFDKLPESKDLVSKLKLVDDNFIFNFDLLSPIKVKKIIQGKNAELTLSYGYNSFFYELKYDKQVLKKENDSDFEKNSKIFNFLRIFFWNELKEYYKKLFEKAINEVFIQKKLSEDYKLNMDEKSKIIFYKKFKELYENKLLYLNLTILTENKSFFYQTLKKIAIEYYADDSLLLDAYKEYLKKEDYVIFNSKDFNLTFNEKGIFFKKKNNDINFFKNNQIDILDKDSVLNNPYYYLSIYLRIINYDNLKEKPNQKELDVIFKEIDKIAKPVIEAVNDLKPLAVSSPAANISATSSVISKKLSINLKYLKNAYKNYYNDGKVNSAKNCKKSYNYFIEQLDILTSAIKNDTLDNLKKELKEKTKLNKFKILEGVMNYEEIQPLMEKIIEEVERLMSE
ncbi:MAG: hypothetical protein WC393_05660 [Candidatus Nanoarchaeia archaeon]|jgi:hypothetical protein